MNKGIKGFHIIYIALQNYDFFIQQYSIEELKIVKQKSNLPPKKEFSNHRMHSTYLEDIDDLLHTASRQFSVDRTGAPCHFIFYNVCH